MYLSCFLSQAAVSPGSLDAYISLKIPIEVRKLVRVMEGVNFLKGEAKGVATGVCLRKLGQGKSF